MITKTARILSCSIIGLQVHLVTVEVDLTPGLHAFTIVGLPDKSIDEAKERVQVALKNSGVKPPKKFHDRILVNLAPADLKKHGPLYDLPIAIGFLAASLQMKPFAQDGYLFAGELALDGTLRPVRGILPLARFTKEKGLVLVLPEGNAKEALLVEGVTVLAAKNLTEIAMHFDGTKPIKEALGLGIETRDISHPDFDFDMAFVRGQEHGKRALEIAAAGGHNVLLTGSPGSGKTLLARTLPSILPRLTQEEAIEVTSIWSVTGLLSHERPLITERPFRNPHHSSTLPALIGGGTSPRPGEVSLAHRGILFLDEFPEFSRTALEALRQPLEDGVVTVARAKETIRYPARFMLIAAQNPCPCGNAEDPEHTCICSPSNVLRYRHRISGPLLDRIDLIVSVPRLDYETLAGRQRSEASAVIRKRVEQAREIQRERFSALSYQTNAEMGPKDIERFLKLDPGGEAILSSAVDRYRLSPRGYHRVLKVARTIADLAGEEQIEKAHLAEALQYRLHMNGGLS